MQSSRLLTAALALVAISGCTEGDDYTALTPELAVGGCADYQPAENPGPCQLDASEVPVTRLDVIEVGIFNPGTAPLALESVELDSSSDPAFSVQSFPPQVAPGDVATVQVRFAPQLEATVHATLIIRSDAANVHCSAETACDPDSADSTMKSVAVGIVGIGMHSAFPAITVDRESCEFGTVGFDAAGSCTISIGNDGDGPLLVEWVAVTASSVTAPAGSQGAAVFGVQELDITAIEPGTRHSVDVSFSPDAVGEYTGEVMIRSNDPDTPNLTIPVSGAMVDNPTCVIRISNINGNAIAGGQPAVEPLDDITISLQNSIPATDDAEIVSASWSFVDRPSGSTISFSNPEGLETGFIFDGSNTGVDLAGHYIIGAQVTDSYGNSSLNLCELTFDAIPSENFLVQLGWEDPTSDMDLHVVKMDDEGAFCSSYADGESLATSGGSCGHSDCHYSNCQSGVDWDDDGTSSSAGDPSLDVDDTCGYGPENITIPYPTEGTYLVAVHYYSSACGGSGGGVFNTIRVFTNGVLQAEANKTIAGQDDWWESFLVHWVPGQEPVVEPL